MQAALERSRKQADEARRVADSTRRQLEADLRAANRKPASGRAHDLWRRRSNKALEGEDDTAPPARSPAGSLRGYSIASRSQAGEGGGPLEEDGPLSSYQRRLAELRTKRS